jgi:hypothetical protein
MISAADGARVVVAAPMEDGRVVTAPLS